MQINEKELGSTAAKSEVSLRRARILLWLGALMPIIYTVGKGLNEVGGVGPLELIRGGGGIAILFFVRLTMDLPTVRPMRNGLAEMGLIFFLIFAGLSFFWAADPKMTLLKLVPLAATYLCLSKLSTLYGGIEETIHGIVTVAHVILIGTLVQLVIWPSRTYSTDVFGEEPRIHSVLPAISSNLFGLVVAIGIVGVCLKIGPKWTARAPWNVLLVAVYLVLLIGTRSRIITAVAVVMIIVSLLRAMNRSKNASIVGWFGISVIFAGGWWSSTQTGIKDVITDFVIRGQDAHGLTTLTGRTVMWERAIPLIRGQEWWGLGYYSGHRVGLAARDGLFRSYSNLDNTWLESVVGVGLMGTAGLALFVLFGVIRVFKATKGMGSYRLLALLLVSGVSWLTIISPTIQTNTSTLVFFALVVFASRRRESATGGDNLPFQQHPIISGSRLTTSV